MEDQTPKKPSITFGNEVCNINAFEPRSATKADSAQVRLPGTVTFVVDMLLGSKDGGAGDVSVSGNTTAGIASRVQIAAAQNAAHAQELALVSSVLLLQLYIWWPALRARTKNSSGNKFSTVMYTPTP
jgi:hypothetical protein